MCPQCEIRFLRLVIERHHHVLKTIVPMLGLNHLTAEVEQGQRDLEKLLATPIKITPCTHGTTA